MKIEIKSWISESVLFEGDFSCLAEAVKAAVRQSADLSSANLRCADLRCANLSCANLSSANLSYADLSSANLSYANLSYANLSYTNLSYADLSYANLRSANLSSAKNSELAVAMTRILPDGPIIGWKKCAEGLIAKLRIPDDAARSHAFGRKCRAEFVEVLEIWDGKKSRQRSDDRTRRNLCRWKDDQAG